MRQIPAIICLFFVLCSSALAVVDIGDIGVGARTLGMGKAWVGGMDDASAIFTNPAALTLNSNLNVVSMSGNLLGDINYLVMGGSNSYPLGRVGIGYLNASLSGIPITEITGTGSTQAVTQTGVSNYSSSVIYFTYGSKLSSFLRGKMDNVSLGASLKYFAQGFSGGGASLQGAVGSGMDLDLGLLWGANSWSSLGLTINNILPASLGGKFTWQKNSVEEGIPWAMRAGTTLRLLGENAWRQYSKDLNLSLDYEMGRGENRPAVWHTGLEFYPLPMLALRAGIDQKPRATETGVGVDNNLTAGIGMRYAGFTFDYAYHQFGDLTENTTHFFSFGYRGADEKKPPKGSKKGKALPLAEVPPKPKLKTFKDVPENFWGRKPIEYVATLNVMQGYPDGTFGPAKGMTKGDLSAVLGQGNKIKDANNKVTRAEAAVMFARYAHLYVKPKLTAKPFPDVAKTHWAAPSIAACKIQGMFEYLAGKNFEPTKVLSRVEAAEILSKTSTIKEKIKEMIAGE
jgi:hypothetical protein